MTADVVLVGEAEPTLAEKSIEADSLSYFFVYLWGSAQQPVFDRIRGPRFSQPDGSLVITCACDPGDSMLLGNGRAVRCPNCGTQFSRVGRHIEVSQHIP